MATARSKRIWRLLSLPLAVAAIWMAFTAVADWQRSRLSEQVTAQIMQGNRPGSLAAIRALAGARRPLLEPIVRAAASPNRALAEGAQLALSDLVEQWREQCDSGHTTSVVTDGLDDLAAVLDANRESFSATDGPWLTRTTSAIIRLANKVSSDADLELTMHCESVLAAAGQGGLPIASTTSPSRLSSDDSASATKSMPVNAPDDLPMRRKPSSNSEVGQTPSRNSASSSAAESAFSAPPESAYQTIVSFEAATPARAEAQQANDGEGHWSWSSPGGKQDHAGKNDGDVPGNAKSADSVSSKAAARFIETTPPSAETLKSVDARSLLQRWQSTDKSARAPLELELARRGLAKPNAGIVKILLSDRADDRIRLVQDIMAAPGINTKAWLRLFAEDTDADVRLAAITLMSTSNDPQLVDQAYQATLHDRDPRVADLAGRLRDRRDNVERR